jgi:hypothetical protein
MFQFVSVPHKCKQMQNLATVIRNGGEEQGGSWRAHFLAALDQFFISMGRKL